MAERNPSVAQMRKACNSIAYLVNTTGAGAHAPHGLAEAVAKREPWAVDPSTGTNTLIAHSLKVLLRFQAGSEFYRGWMTPAIQSAQRAGLIAAGIDSDLQQDVAIVVPPEKREALRSAWRILDYWVCEAEKDTAPAAPAAPGTDPPADPPASDPLTLDDYAVALLTRWIKEHRPKISRRKVAETLGYHHSSLDDCPTFNTLWASFQEKPPRGYRNARTGNIEAADDG